LLDVRTSTNAAPAAAIDPASATISSAIAISATAIDTAAIGVPTAVNAAAIYAAAVVARHAIAVIDDTSAERGAEVPAGTTSIANLDEIVLDCL
jgi:hypothetical protein